MATGVHTLRIDLGRRCLGLALSMGFFAYFAGLTYALIHNGTAAICADRINQAPDRSGELSAGATRVFVDDVVAKVVQESPLFRPKKLRQLAVTGFPAGGSIGEKGKVRLAVFEEQA